MSDNLQHSFEEIDKDLASSWIDLSSEVRMLAADIKLKAAATELASDAEQLSQKASRLCDHVERIHTDVIDLLENIETRIPDISRSGFDESVDTDEVEKEQIQVQRESHEMRSDFKDVLKALFMWVDDPKERVREKKNGLPDKSTPN